MLGVFHELDLQEQVGLPEAKEDFIWTCKV